MHGLREHREVGAVSREDDGRHEGKTRGTARSHSRGGVAMAITTMIGAKIHRREDPRLVSGEGRYIDDHRRPGTVYLSVVRSPHAHALIKSIDITAASKAPGVVAIYTHKDFAKVIDGTMPA